MKTTAFTFGLFWEKYHMINPQYKRNTSSVKKLFNSINCIGKQKAIIKRIEKSKLNGLDYLKSKI